MKDFYLNFYFQVLAPLHEKIKSNATDLLMPEIFANSNSNYYIPKFSGKAFELLVRTILERKAPPNPHVHEQLLLSDFDYDVLDYWTHETQVDLLVEHRRDRVSRVLECKWVGQRNSDLSSYVQQTLEKKYIAPATYTLRYFLVVSKTPTRQLLERARLKDVTVIDLPDLFAELR